MRASSQETVHMWGQDVPSIGRIQEVITIGAGTPDRDIGGMTGGTLGQLLGGQPLRMCGKLIEKASLYPGRDDIHGLESITPLLQPGGLLLQAEGLGISHPLSPCPSYSFVLRRPTVCSPVPYHSTSQGHAA